MSQASKHLEWCLNKAKREIEECKNQGKRIKHRGLRKIRPDLERAKEHVEKAEHELEVTEYLKKGKFLDAGVSTIFYSMYHCFLAIAAKFGYESSNQTCSIALIESLKEEGKIDIDMRFIDIFKYKESEEEKKDSLIEMREDYTYSTKLSFNAAKLNALIEMCRELIEMTKEIIFKNI